MAPSYASTGLIDSQLLYDAYDQAQGPFVVQAEGRPSLIVMQTTELVGDEPIYTEAELEELRTGLTAVQRGETFDARASLAEALARNGL